MSKNPFKDLGLKHPKKLLKKSDLMIEIERAMRELSPRDLKKIKKKIMRILKRKEKGG